MLCNSVRAVFVGVLFTILAKFVFARKSTHRDAELLSSPDSVESSFTCELTFTFHTLSVRQLQSTVIRPDIWRLEHKSVWDFTTNVERS